MICHMHGCRNLAIADPDEDEPILCEVHKAEFRAGCPSCGGGLTDDMDRLGCCGKCLARMTQAEEQAHRDKKGAEFSAKWWALLEEAMA